MTKRLTPAEKMTNKRSRELRKLARIGNTIEAGRLDHMFANVETKAALLADLKAEMLVLINAEIDANPGLYQRHPDCTISLRSDTVVPLRAR
jgi:hypothetical protein